jgi:predicted permease
MSLRYALRRLGKQPLFFLTAVSTLALGVGINALVFSFVNFFLLRPLPIADPGEVVSLTFGEGNPTVSYPNYLDIRDRNQAFSHLASMRVMPMHLTFDGAKARLWGYLVSGNYFELLGVGPFRGRVLSSSDDVQTGAHPVAVLSHASWLRRFGGATDVVGSAVRINGHPFTIVGIAPPGFAGTERVFESEIWIPFSMIREIEDRDWRESRSTSNAWAIARVKPGISVSEAEASLTAVAQELAREHPEVNEGLSIRLVPPGLLGSVLRVPLVGASTGLLLLAGLTLLVACANLSNLLLSQGAARARELALRLSLGASRSALARMMLAESAILAFVGGALGLVSGYWLMKVAASWMPALDFPLPREFTFDFRVAVLGGLAALASAFLSGLLPAWRSSRLDPAPSLKGDPRREGSRRFHLRDVYVTLQVVVSVVLMAGSLMMVRALTRASALDFGFVPEGAATLRFDPVVHGYDEERGRELHRLLLQRVRSLPGVEAAGIANSIPFSVDQSFGTVYPEGGPPVSLANAPRSVVYQATPGFFRAMGTALLSGRDFADGDDRDAPPVAIVNETLAAKLFPGEDAVSKRIAFRAGSDLMEIVGVVEAGKYQTVTESPQLALWRPLAQSYNGPSTLVARGRLADEELLSMLERTVGELDPELVVFDNMALSDSLDLPMTPLRLSAFGLTAMGLIAVFLSCLGVYALIAHAMTRRTRELGIRIALGARPREVLSAVLKRSALLVGASIGVGTLLAFFANRLLAGVLFAVPEASVYVLAASLVALASAAALWFPSRRALRIEPLKALRYE